MGPSTIQTPLETSARKAETFCYNLLYSAACNETVRSVILLEESSETLTAESKQDLKFCLQTLFMNPFIQNS